MRHAPGNDQPRPGIGSVLADKNERAVTERIDERPLGFQHKCVEIVRDDDGGILCDKRRLWSESRIVPGVPRCGAEVVGPLALQSVEGQAVRRVKCGIDNGAELKRRCDAVGYAAVGELVGGPRERGGSISRRDCDIGQHRRYRIDGDAPVFRTDRGGSVEEVVENSRVRRLGGGRGDIAGEESHTLDGQGMGECPRRVPGDPVERIELSPVVPHAADPHELGRDAVDTHRKVDDLRLDAVDHLAGEDLGAQSVGIKIKPEKVEAVLLHDDALELEAKRHGGEELRLHLEVGVVCDLHDPGHAQSAVGGIMCDRGRDGDGDRCIRGVGSCSRDFRVVQRIDDGPERRVQTVGIEVVRHERRRGDDDGEKVALCSGKSRRRSGKPLGPRLVDAEARKHGGPRAVGEPGQSAREGARAGEERDRYRNACAPRVIPVRVAQAHRNSGCDRLAHDGGPRLLTECQCGGGCGPDGERSRRIGDQRSAGSEKRVAGGRLRDRQVVKDRHAVHRVAADISAERCPARIRDEGKYHGVCGRCDTEAGDVPDLNRGVAAGCRKDRPSHGITGFTDPCNGIRGARDKRHTRIVHERRAVECTGDPRRIRRGRGGEDR